MLSKSPVKHAGLFAAVHRSQLMWWTAPTPGIEVP
jgi:hypothetical protein